jgi:hypothetical protein
MNVKKAQIAADEGNDMDTMNALSRTQATSVSRPWHSSACTWMAAVLLLSSRSLFAISPTTHSTEQTPAADQGRLYPVLVDGNIGFVNRQGKYVVQPVRAAAGVFLQEGLLYLGGEHSTKITDRSGRVLLESGKPMATLGRGRFGVPDDQGQMHAVGLIEPFSSDVHFTSGRSGSEGLIPVRVADKWGFLDDAGKLAIPPRFDGAIYFRDGLAAVRVGAKWGYINHLGDLVVPAQFLLAKQLDEGLAPVTSDGRAWYYIDAAGRRPFAKDFAEAGAFHEGLAAVCDRDTGLYGFIDKAGEFRIPPQYKSAGWFAEGMAGVSIRGRVSGYIDHKGELAIKYPTDDALLWPFDHGVAMVEADGRSGYIDRSGAWIWSIESSRWNAQPSESEQRP